MIRGLEHLFSGDSLRVGIDQPGEEKYVGTPYSTFQYLKRPERETERDVLQGHVGIRMSGNSFKLISKHGLN